MSRLLRKWSSGFQTRSNTNWDAQPQKMARDLKFRICEVEGLYYLCSENKGTDQVTTSRSAPFLAHLSRRLIGELIVYPWSGVRRRPSSTMLKHLLLRNPSADQSQILCGASLGRGNEILFTASGSHDQDGHHAHIW